MKNLLPQPSETQVQKAIIQYLQLHGWWVTHVPGGGGAVRKSGEPDTRWAFQRWHRQQVSNGYVPGTPDLLAVSRTGDVLWIEVKKPKGRVSPAQKAVIAELEARECQVLIAWSVDDVIDFLDALSL